jgi:hypothetical protein
MTSYCQSQQSITAKSLLDFELRTHPGKTTTIRSLLGHGWDTTELYKE